MLGASWLCCVVCDCASRITIGRLQLCERVYVTVCLAYAIHSVYVEKGVCIVQAVSVMIRPWECDCDCVCCPFALVVRWSGDNSDRRFCASGLYIDYDSVIVVFL